MMLVKWACIYSLCYLQFTSKTSGCGGGLTNLANVVSPIKQDSRLDGHKFDS